MESQVTPLQEMLGRVRAAEPDASEWAAVQSRVLNEMSAAGTSLSGGKGSAATEPSAAIRSGWKPGLGTSGAIGFVIAGLVLANLPGAVLSDGECCPHTAPEFAAHPRALDVPLPEPQAEVWSPHVNARQRDGNGRRRPNDRDERADGHARNNAVGNADNTAHNRAYNNARSRAQQTESAGVASFMGEPPAPVLGESDVEYDRRHLKPIDAALHAGKPREALALLAAFTPRALTSYASALRAIALCDAGETRAGKRLGVQTLPYVTNAGLSRRLHRACAIAVVSTK